MASKNAMAPLMSQQSLYSMSSRPRRVRKDAALQAGMGGLVVVGFG
jgi:hypothetical protein